MYRDLKISICFPCRNEGGHLREVIERVPHIVDEIIVISNKSTDNTLEVARSLNVIALEDNRTIDNIGYGFAHMTGVDKASGDIIIGADGDSTYPIEDITKMIDFMLDNGIDFLSCNRYPVKKGVQIPLKLQIGVTLLNLEVMFLYQKRIKDILSGMWLFKKEIKSKLKLTMGEWNLSPQIKLNASTNKEIKFSEYSIAQYQRQGESKQNYWKTGISHALWILKNRFKAL